jgi:signal transduction histidine kinase
VTQELIRGEPQPAVLADALAAFDQGARLLEEAYRELWSAHHAERGHAALEVAQRLRDLRHEVQNPLGGVRGLARLLARELRTAPSSGKAARLLDQLIRGIESVEEVLERGTRDADARCDVAEIAEETAGLALAECRARGADVAFRVQAPPGVELAVPAGEVRAVLANLVRNAAEACGPRGTVTVRVASSLPEVVLFVDDDGCGLPPVDDARLFRRGYSSKGAGRGRGLALVDEIVGAHGGTFLLCRKERGTLARVRFPREVGP